MNQTPAIRFKREAERLGVTTPGRQQRYVRARMSGASSEQALKHCRVRAKAKDETEEANDEQR
jgi:hypothetical protein